MRAALRILTQTVVPIFHVKMSDFEESDVSLQSESEAEADTSDEIEVSSRPIQPHQDEPLASSSDDEQGESTEDPDGLLPAVLAARKHGNVPLNNWYVGRGFRLNCLKMKSEIPEMNI